MPTSTPRPATRPVALTVLTWLGRVALALVFLGAGASKLFAEPAMVTMFDEIGAGQWLRLLVGALEIAGAVGVLVPRLSTPAATGLALLMVGATATNLTVLRTSPLTTLALLVLALLVAWAGRRRLAARRAVPAT